MEHNRTNFRDHTIHVKHFTDPHTGDERCTVYVTMGKNSDAIGPGQMGHKSELTPNRARDLVTKYLGQLRANGHMRNPN